MGADVARGEGAHLLEVNEGVHEVLPACCHAAWSTHLPAGAARTVVSPPPKLEGPEITRDLSLRETATSCEHIDATSQRFGQRRVGARLLWCCHPGRRRSHKSPLVHGAHAGEQLPSGGAADARHHAGCGGDAPRLEQWHQLQLRPGKTARGEQRFSAKRRAERARTRIERRSAVGPTTRFGGPQPLHFHH